MPCRKKLWNFMFSMSLGMQQNPVMPPKHYLEGTVMITEGTAMKMAVPSIYWMWEHLINPKNTW
jgi:hypothetical protein